MASEKSKVVTFMARRSKAQILEALFEEHVVALRRFIRGHMASEADLEDIVQDVFARLMSYDDLEARVSSESGSNRSFILSIANSLIVDRERHKCVRRNYSDMQRLNETGRVYDITPEDVASASRELEIIKKVIRSMKPAWRRAFILSRIKLMSYREIAEVMGVSRKQVEHYLVCATAKIRKAEKSIKQAGR